MGDKTDRFFTKTVPAWTALRSLGNNRAVKSSYYWFIGVPIAARAFEKIGSPLNITIFDANFALTLDLPFSWKVVFFAALCFAAASILFRYYCPPALRKYDSFGDYLEQGKHTDSLIRSMWSISRNKFWAWPLTPKKHRFRRFLQDFTDLENKKVQEVMTSDALQISIINTPIPDEKLKAAYYYVAEDFDQSRPIARFVCITLYSAGFLLLLVLVYQNIKYVVLH